MRAMPSLPELQRQFAAAMFGADSSLADWVTPRGLEPQARIQIYRNVIRNNLTAALGTAYPAIQKLVGEEFFDAAAARYIRDYPSCSGNLQDYGAAFPDFLAAMHEAIDLPYLADVARLEWARQESYLAADAAALSQAEMSEALRQPESSTLRFRLHPSLRLVNSSHPIWDIWRFCQEVAPGHLDLSSGGQTVQLWRDAHQLAMLPLAADCYRFTAALLTQVTLAEAYNRAVNVDADFNLMTCLFSLLKIGVITGLSFDDQHKQEEP